MNIYSDDINIEIVQTQSQLENIIKKYSSYDRRYVASAVRKEFRIENELKWNIFKNFADDNYIDQFRRPGQYLQKLWEMNLGLLINSQTNLARKPKAGEPDIITKYFTIECVCPEPKGVPEMVFNSIEDNVPFIASKVPQDEIILRITPAFDSKWKQYWQRKKDSSWAQKDYKDLPYVIALSLADMGCYPISSTSGLNLVEDVLMGVGNCVIYVDEITKALELGVVTRPTVHKKLKVDIPLGRFQKRMYSGISAVIWSSKENPTDDEVFVVHNPLSTKELSSDLLPKFHHVEFVKKNEGWDIIRR